MKTSHTRLGPNKTPKPLKILLLTTFVVSLVSALLNHALPRYFDVTSPQHILGLSSWGIEHLYLWQFFTYLFVHPIVHGISFSFLLSLGFNLYLLWVIGTSIIERRGLNSFFSIYFSSGLFVGLILFSLQTLTGMPAPFFGNTPSLYALLLAWLMLFPEAQLFLLLALPIKAKWLVLVILGANLFIDLSVGEWINAVACLSGAFFGYLYPLFIWKMKSPFPSLHPFEDQVLKVLGAPPKKEFYHHNGKAKIYDFKTGRAILSDDEFLDEMLSKISAHGKGSLTWREKFRLKRISNKRKKQKP
jgi:membrane associated rhomboid family serine protease